MSIFSSIKKAVSSAYTSVDKAIGGVLPGGSPSVLKGTVTVKELPAVTISKPSTTSPTPSPSGGGSSGGGSKSNPVQDAINRALNPHGTYNPFTGTYTDPSGNSYSTATPPKGATITIFPIKPKQSPKGVNNPYAQSTQSQYYGIIEPYQRPKGGYVSEKLGLGGVSAKIQSGRQTLRTEKLRSSTGNISTLKEAKLLGLAGLSAVVDNLRGIVDLPQTAYNILKKPKSLKNLPKLFKEEAKNFGEQLRVSPGEMLVRVGADIVVIKASGSALNKIKDLSEAQLTKLSTKYVGKADVGETLKIPLPEGEVAKIKVVGKIPKESIVNQIRRAGKTVKTSISSQADRLIPLIKNTRIIRKPIPGEEEFSAVTKKLLKKFDKGTITKTELIKLDRAIRKQGAKGLLERSFFADPTGKIRPSRLGLKGKSSIADYLTSGITFKKPKPQILLFRDIKVEAFPSGLKAIVKKLKKGKALTETESAKLLKFQLKKSGKFKPLGFITQESEISLAPGEIIKKVKKVGVTIINGKRVPIIQAKPFKPVGELKTLLKKLEKGTIKKKDILKLDRLLTKKTGLKYGLSSSPKIGARYVSLPKLGASAISKISRLSRKTSSYRVLSRDSRGRFLSSKSKAGSSRSVSKTSSRTYKTSGGSSRKGGSSIKRTSGGGSSGGGYSRKGGSSSKPKPRPSPPRYPPSRPPYTPRKTPPYVKFSKNKRLKRITQGKKIGYTIYEKRGWKGKRFYKLKTGPLSRKQALDKLAYRIDNKISRSARIVPVGPVKKFAKISRREYNYFQKNKYKLRPYKIRKGRKIPLSKAYIEKRRYVLDKPGEKAQLKLNKMAKFKPQSRTMKHRPYSKPKARPSTFKYRGHSSLSQRRDSHGRFIKMKGGKKRR